MRGSRTLPGGRGSSSTCRRAGSRRRRSWTWRSATGGPCWCASPPTGRRSGSVLAPTRTRRCAGWWQPARASASSATHRGSSRRSRSPMPAPRDRWRSSARSPRCGRRSARRWSSWGREPSWRDYDDRMEHELSDRRFDLILERLDRIAYELAKTNKRLDNDENFLRLARELATLNESLQALAYAALGQQAPQVRRRRSA